MTAEQTKDIMAFIDWNPHSPKARTLAYLAYREILQDIDYCLRTVPAKSYLTGFQGKIRSNNLSTANWVRGRRIYPRRPGKGVPISAEGLSGARVRFLLKAVLCQFP